MLIGNSADALRQTIFQIWNDRWTLKDFRLMSHLSHSSSIRIFNSHSLERGQLQPVSVLYVAHDVGTLKKCPR